MSDGSDLCVVRPLLHYCITAVSFELHESPTGVDEGYMSTLLGHKLHNGICLNMTKENIIYITASTTSSSTLVSYLDLHSPVDQTHYTNQLLFKDECRVFLDQRLLLSLFIWADPSHQSRVVGSLLWWALRARRIGSGWNRESLSAVKVSHFISSGAKGSAVPAPSRLS